MNLHLLHLLSIAFGLRIVMNCFVSMVLQLKIGIGHCAELKFRKNKEEKNGDLVYSTPYVKHARAYTLVIKEVEE